MELLDDKEELEQEQVNLYDHDDNITDYISRLQAVVEVNIRDTKEEAMASIPLLGRQLTCIRIKRKTTGVQESVDAA